MIAEGRGRPVGYALVTLGEGSCGWETGRRVADVETLSVLPDARGRGIGTRLMDAVEEQLAGLGVRELRLLVIAPNADALDFYEARGMTTVSHVLMGQVGHA
jgi:ribosomal protein S18 acetylase RimI-like enzyme